MANDLSGKERRRGQVSFEKTRGEGKGIGDHVCSGGRGKIEAFIGGGRKEPLISFEKETTLPKGRTLGGKRVSVSECGERKRGLPSQVGGGDLGTHARFRCGGKDGWHRGKAIVQ